MLKWYPIDITTVPLWTSMGGDEACHLFHVDPCRIGTEMVWMTQHKGVHHLDLMVMCFVEISLLAHHACIGKVCDWNSWLLMSY